MLSLVLTIQLFICIAQHVLTQTSFSSGHSNCAMEVIEVAPLAIFRPMEITLAALDKGVQSRADALVSVGSDDGTCIKPRRCGQINDAGP